MKLWPAPIAGRFTARSIYSAGSDERTRQAPEAPASQTEFYPWDGSNRLRDIFGIFMGIAEDKINSLWLFDRYGRQVHLYSYSTVIKRFIIFCRD
jgi:hypothetical protein